MRIAVLDDYTGTVRSSADWEQIERSHSLTFFHDHLPSGEALIRRLEGFDIIVVERERTPFRRELIEALPELKLLVATGPVNWSIDLDAAEEHGVVVSCTDAIQDLTSELTMGLILALARRIVAEDRGVREGYWQRGVGTSLVGKTLGLIGLGQVGTNVARLAAAFGMGVIAWSGNLTEEAAAERGARRVDLDDVLTRSDVISLHVVLGDRTRGLIGRRELGLMKQSAFLVNTARGPIVNEDALIEALEERRIAGAALDVFETEPLPREHPFRRLDNVIAMPHIGYISDDQNRLLYGQVVKTIEMFASGMPVRRLLPASL